MPQIDESAGVFQPQQPFKLALGTEVDLPVFRKLKQIDYLTSCPHSGRFYTLREIARFGADGLWSCGPAGFSRYGTWLATDEAFIRGLGCGLFCRKTVRNAA